MSALTSYFRTLANKIRSKTGSSDTYTPVQMVNAINDVYDAGVASATTPITPSNASPVSMSANTGYKPTENGVAIKSYTSIEPNMSVLPDELTQGSIYKASVNCYAIRTYNATTPSDSSPVELSNKSIHRISGTGYAIESNPTSVTPSDSSPVSLSSGSIYKAGGNGYAIESQPTSITPSNSSPADITSGGIYRATASGKAVASVTAKTPSDTSPASVTSGSIIKPSSNGYLYKTQQTKSITLIGSITISDTNGHNVALTKAVKDYRYIMVCFGSSVATDKVYGNSTGGGCAAVVFFDTNKWASGFSAEGAFTVGSGNSQSSKTDKIAYYSGSVMTITHSHANSRTDNIYGIN